MLLQSFNSIIVGSDESKWFCILYKTDLTLTFNHFSIPTSATVSLTILDVSLKATRNKNKRGKFFYYSKCVNDTATLVTLTIQCGVKANDCVHARRERTRLLSILVYSTCKPNTHWTTIIIIIMA